MNIFLSRLQKASITSIAITASVIGSSFFVESKAVSYVNNPGPLTKNRSKAPGATLDYNSTKVEDTCKLFGDKRGQLAAYADGNRQYITSYVPTSGIAISNSNPRSASVKAMSTAPGTKWKVRADTALLTGGSVVPVSSQVSLDGSSFAGFKTKNATGTAAGSELLVEVDVKFKSPTTGFTPDVPMAATVVVTCLAR